jgi:hypothetical protein
MTRVGHTSVGGVKGEDGRCDAGVEGEEEGEWDLFMGLTGSSR